MSNALVRRPGCWMHEKYAASIDPGTDEQPDVTLDTIAVRRASGDEELSRVFADGDPDALRLAYDRYGALVYTFCRRTLFSSTDAEDASQQVFLIAWQRRDRFDPERGSLAGWLIGIARNVVRESQRRRARLFERRDRLVEAARSGTDRGSMSDDLDPESVADRLLMADALQQLTSEQRRVIELAFYAGLTQSEIAEELGTPLGTVKSHARRGLARLRHHLEAGDAG